MLSETLWNLMSAQFLYLGKPYIRLVQKNLHFSYPFGEPAMLCILKTQMNSKLSSV